MNNIELKDGMVYKMGTVYTTTNYRLFKRIKGNRRIRPTRVKELVEDMKKNGWRLGPIFVNKDFEILNGQHRALAAEEAGVPIDFLIIEGGIDDVKDANGDMIWVMLDYILSYIELGNENYIRLYEMMQKYKATYTLVLRATNISTNQITKKSMMNGTLIFAKEHCEKADKKIPLVYDICNAMSSIGFRGNKTVKEAASLFVIEHYDASVVSKLCAAIERATPTYLSTMNTQSLLDSFERLYNKGKSRQEKLYFGSDYKREPRAQGVEARFNSYNGYISPSTTAKIALGA